jgi:hypothetical protein
MLTPPWAMTATTVAPAGLQLIDTLKQSMNDRFSFRTSRAR